MAFQSREFQTTQLTFALELQECDVEGVTRYVNAFSEGDVPSPAALMSGVAKPSVAKFDYFLSSDLMTAVMMRERLEIDALPTVAGRLSTAVPTV